MSGDQPQFTLVPAKNGGGSWSPAIPNFARRSPAAHHCILDMTTVHHPHQFLCMTKDSLSIVNRAQKKDPVSQSGGQFMLEKKQKGSHQSETKIYL
jgi:hypothetical protein